MTSLAAGAIAGATGAIVAWAIVSWRLRRPPTGRTRINFRGHPVPAVLGDGLAGGALVALAPALLADTGATARIVTAMAVALGAMFAAGLWDDARGAERARGFAGHARALRGGGVTGGIVKLMAGGLSGLLAGAILASGQILPIIEIALLVALAANAVNLFDRAPGRALKVSLLVAVPLVIWGSPGWGVAAAGLLAALAVCAPFDLAERGMLGDAGANPLGAALGLGVALALPEVGRVAAIVVLAIVNLTSEKISFSAVIERNRVLSWLDRAGRAQLPS